jgi:hypothetical protein
MPGCLRRPDPGKGDLKALRRLCPGVSRLKSGVHLRLRLTLHVRDSASSGTHPQGYAPILPDRRLHHPAPVAPLAGLRSSLPCFFQPFSTFWFLNKAIASISTSKSSRHNRAWIPVLAGSGSRPSHRKNIVRTSLKSL